MVSADPTTPQISPLHRQREDAQRLTEEQRGLDRTQPAGHLAEGVDKERPPASTPQAAATPSFTGGGHTTRGAGLALLGVAGLSAVIALPLLALDTPLSGDSQSTYDSLAKILLATSAITGITGIVFLAVDRRVQVTPTVSSSAVGIAIMGRM
jgi:hypothetical protein